VPLCFSSPHLRDGDRCGVETRPITPHDLDRLPGWLVIRPYPDGLDGSEFIEDLIKKACLPSGRWTFPQFRMEKKTKTC
jgi:hypothetical protein